MAPKPNPSNLLGPKIPGQAEDNSAGKRIPSADEKTSFLAYFFWSFGGCFGLHHLYLGRPIQAGIWGCTFGWCWFGFAGLIRDIFCIPSYVDAANDSEAEQEQLEVAMKYSKVPPWRFTRLVGCTMLGTWFSLCGWCWGPQAAPLVWFQVMTVTACALGVHLGGCACTHQTGGKFIYTLGGCAAGYIISQPSLGALIGFQWFRQWKPEATKPKLAWWKVLGLVWLFWTVTFFGVVEHASITAQVHGEDKTFNIKECIMNVLRGISMDDFKNMGGGEDEEWSFNWEKFGDQFTSRLDVAGEKRALKTLEMTDFIGKKYTAADVKKSYRSIAMKWHPDKNDDKKKAEAMMQEINSAKEVLDKILS